MKALRVFFAFCVLPVVLPLPPAHAQPLPSKGRLLVTVADPSGAVIPGAKVTLTGTEDATRPAPSGPALTSSEGVAVVEGLPLGRFTIQVEFPGFETIQVRDFRVRAGGNNRTVTLPIKKVAEDVTVERDKQSSSLDPRGNAFSTVLTREQIAMLPDDPDELEAVLKAMAPPGATFRVDGFTGGKLPPKSQIRSIRLPRMDQFAAQNHGSANGMMFIDIMTQPGNGPLRGTLDFTFRDDALNARNPFTPVKGLESLKQGGVMLSGTIVPNRSSFAFAAQRADQLDSGSLFAALPGSTDARAIVQPTARMNYSARFDQATTRDHVLRASFAHTETNRSSLGVGAFDLPERAYETTSRDNVFRLSENGPLGRKLFSESRLQVRWSSTRDQAVVEAPTVRVLDAFTMGGAQRSGGRRAVDVEAATDLDYVRGSHSYRTGLLLEAGRYQSDDSSNYLGTYTFASLADYEAGRASNYSRRLGNPSIKYSNIQFGAYLQDDYRLARSLLLSYGARYEAQTLIPDQNNVSPRATLTWSPFKDGKTTVRTGVGYFNDWLGTGVYEQTLRVDGFRQTELNLLNPPYPDPSAAGSVAPSNKYVLDPALALPESFSLNAGIDRQLGALRLSATYTHRRGLTVLRGTNLNAPINGVRPDLTFSNVVDVVEDAESRTNLLGVNANVLLLNWHQTFFAANYTLGSTRGNSSGAFSLPANGNDLSTEWGLLMPRHRLGGSFSTQPIPNLGVSVNFNAQSGTPYNITTGRDDNRDGLFSDRPSGVARNSALTASRWDLGLRVSYSVGFGTRAASSSGSGGGTVVMVGGGGAMPGGFSGGSVDKRFRVEFYASAQNVTNRANYAGYSGVTTSPFFGLPTTVLNPRKVEIGARFGF